jgi:hypothetical protein
MFGSQKDVRRASCECEIRLNFWDQRGLRADSLSLTLSQKCQASLKNWCMHFPLIYRGFPAAHTK